MLRTVPRHLVAVAVAAAPPLSAQQPITQRPVGGPLATFDAYVARAVKDWGVPGLAVAVVSGDSIVFARGYGVRTLGKPDPVDERTLFAVGSTTKAMTTAALAVLVDEGKVRWDDPVTKYVPTLQLSDPYVTRELTVRDLLTHRTGLPGTDALWYAVPNTLDSMLPRLRYVKPATSLRAGYAYQNVMYAVAGRVVAVASGVPWDEFVRARVLQPAGMTDAVTNYAGLAGRPNVATPHLRAGDTVRAVRYRNLDNIAPAGAVNASALDMARWLRFLLDSTRLRDAGRARAASASAAPPERPRLIADSSFRQLFTPQFLIPAAQYYPAARLAKPHFTAYGLGWFLQDYRGRLVAMHTGSIDGMSAIVGMLPEERVGVVVLANLDHAELRHALMYRVFDLYLAAPGDTLRDWSAALRALYGNLAKEEQDAERKALAARVRNTRPTLPLAAYAGTYTDSVYGDVLVAVEGGLLVAHRGPEYVGDLEHWHYDTFRTRWRDPALGTDFVTFTLDPGRRHVIAAEVEGLGHFDRR